MKTRLCPMCKVEKPLNEYWIRKTGKRAGEPQGYCKICKPKVNLKWYHDTGRILPMSQNKKCSSYLGVHIAETILQAEFEHMIKLPYGYPGGDFICGKGYLIDVKSACLRNRNYYHGWDFNINRNTKADYFLCLGFDDRQNLKPIKIWLIPGNIVNFKKSVCISNTQHSLAKWIEFERPLDKAIACCDAMR